MYEIWSGSGTIPDKGVRHRQRIRRRIQNNLGIDGFHGSIRTGPNRISKGAGVQTSAPFFIFTT
jgi:hypothetical protein